MGSKYFLLASGYVFNIVIPTEKMKVEFRHESFKNGVLSENWFDTLPILAKGTTIKSGENEYVIDRVIIDLVMNIITYNLLKQ